MDKEVFQKLRRDYLLADFSKKTALPDPIAQFTVWMKDALEASYAEPNAMVLATASAEGEPSARMVLLKHVDAESFHFYTNYHSRKGSDLDENPRGALLFYWEELHRQVRIAGAVDRLSREESAAYFQTRPFRSQVSAWASPQSQAIENRAVLEERFRRLMALYEGKLVPIPDYWGGYRLRAEMLEFWQGREDRLHDRIRYTRNGEQWRLERLAP